MPIAICDAGGVMGGILFGFVLEYGGIKRRLKVEGRR